MRFPSNTQKVIADTFYDKVVSVMERTTQVDSEGGIIKSGESVKCTFKGNVRFVALDEELSDIGLVKNADIQITCAKDTPVEVDDILEYDSVKYVVTAALPYDSHLTVVGQKWQKQ